MQPSALSPQPSVLRVVAAAVVGVLIVLGSAFLWIGLPLAGLWVAGELTTGGEGFLLTALGGVPLAMVMFGWLLYRLNAIYVGLRDEQPQAGSPQSPWLVSSSDERSRARRARAPRTLIDVAMTASAVAAMLLLTYFFFFVGQTPLVTPR